LVELVPENLTDLWYLYRNLKEKIVEVETLRKKTIKRGDEFIKGKTKLVSLKIKIEKLKYLDEKIRLGGKIIEGADKGKYHFFNLSINKKIKIFDKLENLPKEEEKDIVICVVDKNSAEIFNNREVKKILAKGREIEYYKEIESFLNKISKPILVCGPKNITGKIKLNKEFFVDTVSHGGKKGLKEVLNRQIINKIFEKISADKEKKYIENIFSKRDKLCYGYDIESELNRIKEIIIPSKFVNKYESLLIKAEEKNVKIKIINNEYSDKIEKFEILGICWY
ncbi:MAG: hypothetical protein B6U88_01980, partial [Candidatus Aenigmarchaeota archaeon ex4484_56]